MAVAHVQTSQKTANGTSSIVTTSMTFSLGGLCLVAVLGYGNGAVVPNISTVKLDATTDLMLDRDSGDLVSGINHQRIWIYNLPNVSAGAHTVTVTLASTTDALTAFMTEASGAATAAPADGAGASTSGTSAAPASGSFTAGASTDFWYSAMCDQSGANPATVTAGAGGWAVPTNGSVLNGSTSLVGGVEYIANPGATSENGQWTIEGSLFWVAMVMAYKAAAGGDLSVLAGEPITGSSLIEGGLR